MASHFRQTATATIAPYAAPVLLLEKEFPMLL
jgi:hypothetical protein